MKYLSSLLILLTILSSNAQAQVSDADIDLIQTKFGNGKKEIVKEYVKIESNKNKQFWILYDDYEQKRKNLGKKRLNLVLFYNNNQLVLKDDELDSEIDHFIELKEETNELIEKYYRKIRRTIGAKTASDFYVIEVYFQSIVRTNYMKQIPFLNEIDNKYKDRKE
jgi:hypothetical protein